MVSTEQHTPSSWEWFHLETSMGTEQEVTSCLLEKGSHGLRSFWCCRVFGLVAEVLCRWGFGFCLMCFPLINVIRGEKSRAR